MKDAETLSKTALFRDIPSNQLQKMAQIAEERRVGPGTELLREGGESNELLVVLLGTVKITKRNGQGRDEEIATLGTGSYLGEVEFVSADHEIAATATAQETTTLLSLKRDAIERLCEEDHTLGYHLFRALARGLGRRLSFTNETAARFKGMAIRARD